ncbi:hypothetical protein LCGC14_2392500 [marine sediment metagenome]|uniref:Uncharacterized protein n=1 Tax=marine sediment metagenome TaxID=412755 RepID=A0A0F9EA54_9ZZZZ
MSKTCSNCRDGKLNLRWVVVRNILYPHGINYHRNAEGAVLCSRCKRLLGRLVGELKVAHE